VLGDTIVDAYVPLQSGKEMWDALLGTLWSI
jgi:hypothetical protein